MRTWLVGGIVVASMIGIAGATPAAAQSPQLPHRAPRQVTPICGMAVFSDTPNIDPQFQKMPDGAFFMKTPAPSACSGGAAAPARKASPSLNLSRLPVVLGPNRTGEPAAPRQR